MQDNRCPIGVQCITGGKATARIQVAQVNAAPYEVEIDLGQTKGLPGGYAMTCEEVYPVPGALTSSVLVSSSSRAPSADTVEGSKAAVAPEDYDVQVSVALPADRMRGLVNGLLKWSLSNAMIRGYTFSERRLCYCTPDTTRPVTLQVGAWSKTVEGYYNDVPNAKVSADALAAYKTVGDLFLLLSHAYTLNADRIEATYDPILGYPTRVFIDQSADLADDDIVYETYALKVA